MADILKDLEDEARSVIEARGPFSYLSRRTGIYIMFKRNAEDLMKIAYVCPKCKHSEKTEVGLKHPYTLNCSKCNELIFKQEKISKKGIKSKG